VLTVGADPYMKDRLNSQDIYIYIYIYTNIYIYKQTPWPQSVIELYRSSDRRLSAKLVPTFADRGCHVIRVTGPYGRIQGFVDREEICVCVCVCVCVSTAVFVLRCTDCNDCDVAVIRSFAKNSC
jgi:hypothetical protein